MRKFSRCHCEPEGRGNPVYARLDCFAALAMTIMMFLLPNSLFAADRFSSGHLLSLEYRESGDAQILELQFDRPTSFSKSFIPVGKRTKSKPKLLLDFPNTKIKHGIVRHHQFHEKALRKYSLEKSFSYHGAELQVEFEPNSDYKISEKGKMVSILIFKTVVAKKSESKREEKKPVAKKETPLAQNASQKFVIVIDPGHGGEDVGAVGKNGNQEKKVVLAIAQKLAAELRREKNLQVYLTRDKDKTLTLEERNAVARSRGADLFLSIHANASTNRSVKGVQTYYLNNATDEASKRLAARENKNAGVKLPTEKQILSTMLQNDSAEESRVLAREIQRNILGTLRKSYKNVNDLKVRSALFYVLVGAKCPGVLVETSFISNSAEEKRLTSKDYQRQMAQGIALGVKDFLLKQAKVNETL